MNIPLDQPLAVEVTGSDAVKILHNLTTNQIQTLQIGESLETFVTDVRGWAVAHGLVYRAQHDRWLLVGQHPDSAAVNSHIDRYIIREKAVVKDLSSVAKIELCISNPASEANSADTSGYSSAVSPVVQTETIEVPFLALGPQASLQLQFSESTTFVPVGVQNATSAEWELLRIAHFWPRMGVDIWEKCIPQEIDRDAQAISFTKGCYLGQETIARLDARGQIQKKLCLLSIDGVISPGDKLLLNDLEVGHITSSATVKQFCLALAVLRRGHFAINTRLTCQGLAAQVIDTSTASGFLSI